MRAWKGAKKEMENAQPEPSMEEILASIRRIIAEDEDETPETQGAADTAVAEAPEPSRPEPAPTVMREVEPERPAPSRPTPVETPPAPQPAAPSYASAPASVAPTVETPARKDAPTMAEPARAIAQEDYSDDDLVDSAAASAAASAFDSLTANVRVSESGPTLEAIVAQMMKPLLKQWIDENLPGIVEEKVELEIKRIARRGR